MAYLWRWVTGSGSTPEQHSSSSSSSSNNSSRTGSPVSSEVESSSSDSEQDSPEVRVGHRTAKRRRPKGKGELTGKPPVKSTSKPLSKRTTRDRSKKKSAPSIDTGEPGPSLAPETTGRKRKRKTPPGPSAPQETTKKTKPEAEAASSSSVVASPPIDTGAAFNKLSQPESLTAEQADLVTAEELEALNTKLQTDFSQTTGALTDEIAALQDDDLYTQLSQQLSEEVFTQINVSITEANQNWEDIDAADAPDKTLTLQGISASITDVSPIVVSARHLLLRIHNTLGRRWAPSALANPRISGENFSALYNKLVVLDNLRGPALDQVHLEYISQLYASSPKHLKVVIEGGGPTGLMQAIKAIMAGADVIVVEQRSGNYTRTQILRLDPLWMKELRFYLGEEFDRLFDPVTGKGKLKADGSGHIMIRHLEEALQDRLVKLISIIGSGKCQFINHKLTGCSMGTASKKCSVTTTYTESGRTKPEAKKHPVDILICAGGKKSPTRDQFFNHVPVTDEKYYGVATWESDDIDNDDLQTFPMIQSTTEPTPIDLHEYCQELNSEMHPGFSDFAKTLSYKARTELAAIMGMTNFDAGTWAESLQDKCTDDDIAFFVQYKKRYQTDGYLQEKHRFFTEMRKSSRITLELRNFENRKAVYLGMEIPKALYLWMKSANESIDKLLSEDELAEVDAQRLKQAIRDQWFQFIADKQGFSSTTGAELSALRGKTAIFPVSQDRNSRNLATVKNRKGGPDLHIVTVGDASTSPHFMTASGLSGARETVNAVTELIHSCVHAKPDDRETLKQASSKLDKHFNRTTEFVINRGSQFLRPLAPDEINRRLEKRSRERLRKAVEQTREEPEKFKYQVTEDDGLFVVTQANQVFHITITTSGDLDITQQETGKASAGIKLNPYSTFEHFALENLQ